MNYIQHDAALTSLDPIRCDTDFTQQIQNDSNCFQTHSIRD